MIPQNAAPTAVANTASALPRRHFASALMPHHSLVNVPAMARSFSTVAGPESSGSGSEEAAEAAEGAETDTPDSLAHYDRPFALLQRARTERSPGSLSNQQARYHYLLSELDIPNEIDQSQPLEDQARKAHGLRNSARSMARDLMSDRELAAKLDKTDPHMSWEQINEKYAHLPEEERYRKIIERSQKSRPSANRAVGLQ